MTIDFKNLFQKALNDERKILRPFFFPSTTNQAKLVTEESYVRLRLARMFLKERRKLFQTKYPVVNALTRFAGLDGIVEVNFVVKPEMAGDSDTSRLDDIVSLDQTLLGPVLYRGGDMELMLGLYAAPADDWAQRFIQLAEGISQLTLNSVVSTAISMTSTIKTAIENALSGDGLDLKLGLDQELKENVWLAPGHLVMIAAPENSIDVANLVIKDGELRTEQGDIYSEHDYLLLEIEVTSQRSDWQTLGYGRLWDDLLNMAANANDIQAVKSSYTTFSGVIMASDDLSWADRTAIVSLAQQRVKAIREVRNSTGFLDGMKDANALLQLEDLLTAVPALPTNSMSTEITADPFTTNWLE
ncbi:MAG: hypothetical protein AAF614_25280 [Chloroflexota bacterium]